MKRVVYCQSCKERSLSQKFLLFLHATSTENVSNSQKARGCGLVPESCFLFSPEFFGGVVGQLRVFETRTIWGLCCCCCCCCCFCCCFLLLLRCPHCCGSRWLTGCCPRTKSLFVHFLDKSSSKLREWTRCSSKYSGARTRWSPSSTKPCAKFGVGCRRSFRVH